MDPCIGDLRLLSLSLGGSVAMDASTSSRPWAFLSPDLLLIITSHLHHAIDFVRFHAVCRSWRDAEPSLILPAAPRNTFMPWIISRSNGRIMQYPVIYSRNIATALSRTERNGIVLVEPDANGVRNWVADADGWAAWLFAQGPETTLCNLVTGSITSLPPFTGYTYGIKQHMSNPLGIVYRDGTVFLYNFLSNSLGCNHVFVETIHHPGDLAWTFVKKKLDLCASDDSCAVYHDGKVLLWVGTYHWCVLTPNYAAYGGDIVGGRLQTTWDKVQEERYMCNRNYILESRGELLWASVLLERKGLDKYVWGFAWPNIAVTMYALEEAGDGSGKMRWVETDYKSLGDHVFFLGSPSYATDATELDVDGGCAYFVFNGCVFTYNFINGETRPMDGIYPAVGNIRLWLRPQPKVAPILEIRARLETRSKE